MADGEIPIRTVKASEARERWRELLDGVFRREARVVVEKSGIPVAAIISVQDLRLLERAEVQRMRDFAVLEEMSQAFRDVAPEELEREADRAVRQVREERRAGRWTRTGS